MSGKIQMIPVERVRILRPRHCDGRRFEDIVESIKQGGPRRPIQVKERPRRKAKRLEYDLINGLARFEAWVALGQKRIPAIIKPDRRRPHG